MDWQEIPRSKAPKFMQSGKKKQLTGGCH